MDRTDKHPAIGGLEALPDPRGLGTTGIAAAASSLYIEMLMRYGFTSVFDTGSYLRLTNVILRRIKNVH